MRLLTAVLLACAVFAHAFSQHNADAPKAETPYTISHKPIVGDMKKYKIRGELTIANLNLLITATIVRKVIEVKDNGENVVEESQEDTVIKIGDQEVPPQHEASLVVHYGKFGEVLDLKKEGAVLPAEARLEVISNIYFPKKAVIVGESWSVDIPANEKMQTVALRATFKLSGVETVSGHQVFKIDYESHETEGQQPAKVEGTCWLDTQTGCTVQDEATWTDMPSAGANTMSGKVALHLQE
ncbi:MAG: hypothetical protein JSS72_02505 [Armatimonadetes bacterium]|nr:hypothetical protein [Armatimonadota bacterium]